jgi:hypothetical protein
VVFSRRGHRVDHRALSAGTDTQGVQTDSHLEILSLVLVVMDLMRVVMPSGRGARRR